MTSTGPRSTYHSAIGIDVSKDHLDVCRLPGREHRRFSNTIAGLDELIGWVKTCRVDLTIFEATGAYHRALERALGEAELTLCKVNPLRAKRFAEALGHHAKTDPLDAEALASMALAGVVGPTPPVDAKALHLKELEGELQSLIALLAQTEVRLKTLQGRLVIRQAKTRRDRLKRQIAELEAEIARTIATDTGLQRRLDILTSIPGIAQRTAARLLIRMPELGTLTPGQAASLSGTAPRTRQSGQWKGVAFVHGGRADVRKALYMPAIVARRCNPDLKRLFERLTSQGKPAKLALTAIMRKLIILANALIRDNRKWTPETS